MALTSGEGLERSSEKIAHECVSTRGGESMVIPFTSGGMMEVQEG